MEPDLLSADDKKLALELIKDRGQRYLALQQELDQKIEKTRRNVLLSGAIGVVVGQTNLVPSKIESLGISFDQLQQANFRYVLAAIVAYFLLAFTHLWLTRIDRSIANNVAQTRLQWQQNEAVKLLHEIADFGDRYKSRIARVGDAIMLVILPYIVGATGLAAIFHWLPKWLLVA